MTYAEVPFVGDLVTGARVVKSSGKYTRSWAPSPEDSDNEICWEGYEWDSHLVEVRDYGRGQMVAAGEDFDLAALAALGRTKRCWRCGHVGGGHGLVHVRHGNGGGHNEPCPGTG